MEKAQPPRAAAKTQPVRLTWYLFGTQEPEQELVYEAFNKITSDKIGVQVDFMMLDAGSYEQKMQLVIAASEPYDLCWTSTWRNNYHQNVAKSAFLPLDDLIKSNGRNITRVIPEKFLSAAKVNGKMYGVPNFQVSTMQNGLYVRSSMAKKYNFDISKAAKLEDLEPFLKEVAAKEKGTNPFDFTGQKGQPWPPLLVYYGLEEVTGRNIPGVIRFRSTGLKVENQFASPEFARLIALMREWNKKGYISQDTLTKKDDLPDKKAGKSMSGVVANATPDTKAIQLNSANMEVDFVTISEPVLFTSSILSTLTAVSQNTEHPDKAVALIDLMASDKEAMNTIAFGIQGKHYTVSDGQAVIPADSLYKNMNAFGWIYGNVFNMLLKPGEKREEKDAVFKGNQEAAGSPLLGFAFDAAPVKAEIAQCKSVTDEMLAVLVSGFSGNPEEDLAKFLAKLDKAGAQKIVDEAQRQIDEWRKPR